MTPIKIFHIKTKSGMLTLEATQELLEKTRSASMLESIDDVKEQHIKQYIISGLLKSLGEEDVKFPD